MKTISKKILLMMMLLSTTFNFSFGADCVVPTDFTATVSDYNNDVIYPVGSVLASSGDLKVIKTMTASGGGNFQETSFTSITSAEVMHHGFLTFDVSTAAYSCRTLTISDFAERVVVDGDTTNIIGTIFPFTGSGYTIDTIGGVITVSGVFDQVDTWIQTGQFSSACLEACPTPPAPGCIDALSFTETVSDYNSDVIYPIGSVLTSAGDLKVIKTMSGAWAGNFDQTSFTSINATEVMHHGFLTFDVSDASYTCRELTFSDFPEEIIVDGDTLVTIGAIYPYVGSGFTVDTVSAGSYVVSGEFDQVTIWLQTGLLTSVCLDACASAPTTGCLNTSLFTDDVADYNNDTSYPAGAILATNGELSIIKTLPSAPNGNFQSTSFLYVNSNEVGFHGYLGFDASAASYACKVLTIDAYAEKVIVDGDTVNVFGTVFPYAGTGFSVDTTGGVYTIMGTFSNVTLWIPTGILYGACLESCPDCQASFTYNLNQSIVEFTNTSSVNSTEADQFTWDFGDGTTSTENDPMHTYDAPGIYTVCLLLVDWDCVNPTMQYCETITVSGCPSGNFTITPNNDGDNDNIFIPANSIIYDRNGFIVKTVEQELNWDGTTDDNQPAAMGYYVVKCGELGVFNVTIVR
jgi:PKD repeat protein